MGPWFLHVFYYHTSCTSGTMCGISFMEVRPQTFKVFNKMWSHRIMEFQNDGRTWQIQYSPTFSMRGYNNIYHWKPHFSLYNMHFPGYSLNGLVNLMEYVVWVQSVLQRESSDCLQRATEANWCYTCLLQTVQGQHLKCKIKKKTITQ